MNEWAHPCRSRKDKGEPSEDGWEVELQCTYIISTSCKPVSAVCSLSRCMWVLRYMCIFAFVSVSYTDIFLVFHWGKDISEGGGSHRTTSGVFFGGPFTFGTFSPSGLKLFFLGFICWPAKSQSSAHLCFPGDPTIYPGFSSTWILEPFLTSSMFVRQALCQMGYLPSLDTPVTLRIHGTLDSDVNTMPYYERAKAEPWLTLAFFIFRCLWFACLRHHHWFEVDTSI